MIKITTTTEKHTNLLRLALVSALILMVDPAKVGHDDRNWQGDDQHTAQRTNAANYFANHGCWDHISVAKCGKYMMHGGGWGVI